MIIENEPNDMPRLLGIFKHLLAIIMAGYSIFVFVILWIANPDYTKILFLPEYNSPPMGWPLVVLALLFIVAAYAAVIILCNIFFSLSRPRTGSVKAGKVVEIILLVLCLFAFRTATVLIILLGPAALILFQSPVGKIFFGG